VSLDSNAWNLRVWGLIINPLYDFLSDMEIRDFKRLQRIQFNYFRISYKFPDATSFKSFAVRWGDSRAFPHYLGMVGAALLSLNGSPEL